MNLEAKGKGMNLWTTEQVADYLQIKGCKRKATAKRKLLSWGVYPVSLGRGRGLGDRWKPQEIQDAVTRAQSKPEPGPSVNTLSRPISGRPIAEVVLELTSHGRAQ